MGREVGTTVCDKEAMVAHPTLEEIESLDGHDLALVYSEVSSDLETPVSVFMKLRDGGPCFLLESAESGEMWGRYSFLGFDPGRVVRLEGGRCTVTDAEVETSVAGDPVRAVFDMVERTTHLVPPDGMPFAGGAVGYFGYDILPYLEKVQLKGPRSPLPEMMFMFPRRLVMFDHLRSRMRLCVLMEVAGSRDERRRAYEAALEDIGRMAEGLEKRLPLGVNIPLTSVEGDDFEGVESNVTRRQYESMVSDAREYILAGDAFQVVVSQRFTLPAKGDPLSVYRYLRADNPSPYMFYLDFGDVVLVGSSPESMVTNRGGAAVIRPIAGTRPRGGDAASDAALVRELERDEKERAEHIMLVDLARNDLGRVSKPGTVKVESLMEIEKYSHVMHIVSQVKGEMRDGLGNYDLLRASFPAGTVIGAPKVRASEIIDELEPDGRGPYAGAIGYMSYSGDMDVCIAIRTVCIQDGTATVQAGGGIVVDSVPSLEYEESRNKARAVIRALRSAGEAGICE